MRCEGCEETARDVMNEVMHIPGFELLGKVGQGGMAVVWKARQISLDRVVAVKFLNPQASCRPGDQDRLMAEAHAAAHLKHPGIVQVYDAGIADGISYFVMEYVAGYSVGEWLRRKKYLSADDALVVVEYVAQALNYAWKTSGIIHCDIKPDNIMVDLDGAIKVADLGLARSIERLKDDPGEKIEIMGTPGYISPEQSGGFMDLDCRTDIYSLGATLYHLTTGKRLFEDHSDTVAMDLQVTGQVQDPMVPRPDLPLGVAWLIDKMLVKDRKHRYPDWDTVLNDFDRVKKGDLPQRPFPPSGTSTIKRSDRRARLTHEWDQRKQLQQFRSVWMRRIPAMAAVFVMMVLTAFIMVQSWRQRGREPSLPDIGQTLPLDQYPRGGPDANATPADDTSARDLYLYVMDWKQEHPGRHDEAIRRLRQVAEETRGTRYSLMAEDAIARLREKRQTAIEDAWQTVTAELKLLVVEQRFREAAAMALEYDGPWQEELEERLQIYAVELQQRADAYEADRQRAVQASMQRLNVLTEELTDILLTGSIEDALAHLAPRSDEPELAHHQDTLKELADVLQSALALDEEVLASFLPQIGEEITIALDRGSAQYFVRGIRDGRLRMEQRLEGGARVEFEYEVQDLATEEYLKRLGDPERYEVALKSGWHAYRSRDFVDAGDCFAKTHPLLASRLTARTDSAHREQIEDNASREFISLLQTLGIEARPPDYVAVRSAVQNLAREQVPISLAEWVARFRQTYPETGFITRVAPVLQELEGANEAEGDAAVASEGDRERMDIEGAIDDRDLAAVIEMLQNRNPDLNRHEIRVLRDDRNRAFGIAIESRSLRDIGPLAPLNALHVLECRGGDISDLSVLSGLTQLMELYIEGCSSRDFQTLRRLPLRRLELPGSGFSDLNLLRDMPLQELNLNHTAVRDIQRLRGIELRRLELENTRVFALRELRGMPLEVLNLAGTQIKDISMLQDMPLRTLNLARTGVFDFSVLRGMKLRSLNLAQTQFRDLSLLAGMPLQELDLSGTRVSDISVLRDMPLRRLALSNTGVRDMSPLRGAIIESLFIDQCQYVRDLEFTAGMPLHTLAISGSGVRRLTDLTTTALTTLYMENTGIEDITPLRQMPVRYLFLRGSPILDYSPLANMPLRELSVDNPQSGAVQPIIRRIRTLRRVNGAPWPPTTR